MLKVVVGIVIFTSACCGQELVTSLKNYKFGRSGSLDLNLIQNQQKLLAHDVKSLQNQNRNNLHTKEMPSLSQEVEALKNLSRENRQLITAVKALQNQSRNNQQTKNVLSLFQEVEALKNLSRENRQLITALSMRYISRPNSYLYVLTPGRQSWQKSREFCQNWGGDLAMHGVKTRKNRIKIMQFLPTNTNFWIGANDIASEGNWMWVNGERASSSELRWRYGQPDSFGNFDEDCVLVHGTPTASGVPRAHDYPCTLKRHGLCEKKVDLWQ